MACKHLGMRELRKFPNSAPGKGKKANFLLTGALVGFRFFWFIEQSMANYSFAVWIVLSVGLLLLFVYAAAMNLRRRHMSEVDLDEIVPFLLPVDLKALSEAIDPVQEKYLRHSCSPHEYHKIQRKRNKLAAEYLRRMNHNAALLQRVGYGQIHSQNSIVAAQAQELIDAGVHVRLYAFVGLAALFFRRVSLFGSLSLKKVSNFQKVTATNLVPAYEALRTKAGELTSLRNAGFREALVQSL
jgi:hypothetical protein